MMRVQATRPLCVRHPAGELRLRPGVLVEVPAPIAVQLLAKKPDTVSPVLEPGDWAEWLSPALPHQRGEVLAVHPDRTFEVFHPLAEAICRLPVTWVTKVSKRLGRSRS